ncbi:MAG: hypothetical protein QMC95_08280 [Desulfitobacteriaceae bacterium]|nr:hypothetical protein [Desulfitobacteriaceae bacterium]MDI6878034.1 hypothetical protein [Desulfitobacteriaceae bacterium]MDI6914205.1 hypothetical protein [Desulfitobacteriaceae bacterium]
MREKREFNFALRWEQKINQKPSHRLLGLEVKMLGRWAGGAVLIMAVAAAPWLWEYKLQSDLKQVNGNINQLREVDVLWQQAKSLQKQVQSQTELQTIMQKNAHDPGPLWVKLNSLFPLGTVVNAFALQADKGLTLTIAVPNPVDVAQLWIKLRDSNFFQEVDIQNVSLQDKVQTLNLNLKLK